MIELLFHNLNGWTIVFRKEDHKDIESSNNLSDDVVKAVSEIIKETTERAERQRSNNES